MDFVINLFIIIIDQILLFAINIIVARNSGEALYGNFSVATQGLLIIASFLTLGLDSIIDYYIPKLHHMKHYKKIMYLMESIKKFLIPVYFGVCFLGLSVLLVFVLNISPYVNHEVLIHPMYLFVWGTVFIACYNILMHLLRSINQMRLAVKMSLLQNLIYLGLVLLFVYLANDYLVNEKRGFYPHIILLAFVGSYGITDLLTYYFLSKIEHSKSAYFSNQNKIRWWTKINGYTIQNLNVYVFSAIPLLALEFLSHNEHSVGLFAAVNSIITVAYIAIYPLGILIAPEISSALSHSTRQLKKILVRYLKVCVLSSTTVVLIMGFFAKPILIMFKSEFIDALPYLYACLSVIISYGINLPFMKMVMFSSNGNQLGARLTLFLLFAQVVASVILIRKYDILGAVICFIGINVLNTISLLILSRGILIKPKGSKQFAADIA